MIFINRKTYSYHIKTILNSKSKFNYFELQFYVTIIQYNTIQDNTIQYNTAFCGGITILST